MVGICFLGVYALAIYSYRKKKNSVGAKAFLISAISSAIAWFFIANIILQSFDDEGWQGVSLGVVNVWFGLIYGTIFNIMIMAASWASVILIYFIGERVLRKKERSFKSIKSPTVITAICILLLSLDILIKNF
jgi:hypothetical protein